jgi:flagellar basal body-associated protein FliL
VSGPIKPTRRRKIQVAIGLEHADDLALEDMAAQVGRSKSAIVRDAVRAVLAAWAERGK